MNLEKYKQFCEIACDDFGNRLPIRLSKKEEQDLVEALTQLQWLEA